MKSSFSSPHFGVHGLPLKRPRNVSSWNSHDKVIVMMIMLQKKMKKYQDEKEYSITCHVFICTLTCRRFMAYSELVNCICGVGDAGKKERWRRKCVVLGHCYFYYLHIYKNLSIAGGDSEGRGSLKVITLHPCLSFHDESKQKS